MDALDEYLIKIEDFPKLLATLLQEKFVDKVIGAKLKVDKKSCHFSFNEPNCIWVCKNRYCCEILTQIS